MGIQPMPFKMTERQEEGFGSVWRALIALFTFAR